MDFGFVIKLKSNSIRILSNIQIIQINGIMMKKNKKKLEICLKINIKTIFDVDIAKRVISEI